MFENFLKIFFYYVALREKSIGTKKHSVLSEGKTTCRRYIKTPEIRFCGEPDQWAETERLPLPSDITFN
jgi:hypothetical protein